MTMTVLMMMMMMTMIMMMGILFASWHGCTEADCVEQQSPPARLVGGIGVSRCHCLSFSQAEVAALKLITLSSSPSLGMHWRYMLPRSTAHPFRKLAWLHGS
eukprot:3500269-Karenia_brevis.AAC.1